MSDIAISVKNLSKKYHLYDTPKHRLKEALNPWGKKYHKDFYALRDISFDVKKGDIVGVVGKNGSGKSTLLKAITGVLTPTSGSVMVGGKISALLELGTGFNMDYSGIENIYFSGTLMGFSREEMDAKLDDILSFADIGDFVYQPVKLYSSGMFMRLAFAVSTMVDPEVLIIDEALSVGDAKFQRKCFARFEDLRNSQKTILFVSHDINAVNHMCNRAVLLVDGKMVEEGESSVVTKRYHQLLFGADSAETGEAKEEKEVQVEATSTTSDSCDVTETEVQEACSVAATEESSQGREKEFSIEEIQEIEEMLSSREVRYGDGRAEIFDMGILDNNSKKVTLLKTGEKYTIFFRVLFYDNVENLTFGCRIQNTKGVDIFAANTSYHKIKIPMKKNGDIVECLFDVQMNIGPGDFFMTFGIRSLDSDLFFDRRVDAYYFKVQADSYMDPACLVNLYETVSIASIDAAVKG